MSAVFDRIVNIFIDRLIKYLLDEGLPTVYHYIHDEYSNELVQDSNYGHNQGDDYG